MDLDCQQFSGYHFQSHKVSATGEMQLCCGVFSALSPSTACCSIANMTSFVSKLIAFLGFWSLSEHVIELILHLPSIFVIINELKRLQSQLLCGTSSIKCSDKHKKRAFCL